MSHLSTESQSSPRAGEAHPAEAPGLPFLAALASLLGVPDLVAAAPPGRRDGRVWRLRVPETGDAWYWKGRARPLEMDLLERLRRGGGPPIAPVVAARLPDPRAAPSGTDGVCLTEVRGLSLDRALHAGAAIPVDAWARAMAALHTGLSPDGGPDLPRLRDPRTEVGLRLPRWADAAQPAQAADAHAIIGQTLSALGPLAERAAAEWRAGEPVLCHGAFTPAHVLLDHGEVGGVVDWEHALVAPPGYDLAAAVLGLFERGVSARAALALGDALAAAYAAASGRPPLLMGFHLVLGAGDRLMTAVRLRAAGQGGGEVQAWMALLGMCLARGTV